MQEIKNEPETFSEETSALIFSNLQQIYSFQQTFLEALRTAVATEKIAEIFLRYQPAFMIYSQYCNSYPRALMTLETISKNDQADAVFKR
jgi:Rho guanine nucleotide exchange factor 4/29